MKNKREQELFREITSAQIPLISEYSYKKVK